MSLTERALAVLKQWTTKTNEPGKLPLPTEKERKTRQHTHSYVHQDWYMHARDLPLFTFQTIREMLRDPQVRLCLAMRQAPIFGAEFAYIDGVGQDGKPTWVPGVKARNPIVAAWVQRQLQTIWNSYLPHLLASQTWGWAGGEVTLRLTESNLIEIDTLHPRHPKDIRMLELHSSGDPWGIEVKNVAGEGTVQLPFPYSYFVRFRPENGEKYSSSVLIGAYSPWADKWLNGAALDTRRLYMHKDAYGGMKVGYPSDQQVYVNGPDRDPVPARDVALQIAEQRYSGGTVVYPTDHDMNGNAKWTIDDATVASNPQHILQYPKDLDNEIRQGLEIPDGAISNDGSGAWEGKSIPLAAFFSGLDTWVTQILCDIRKTLDPLVLLNWGTAEEYEITHKPLGLQAMEQQGAKRDGNGAMGPMDPMQQQQMDQQSDPYRMSIDPVAAVGRGALKAVDVVKAARTALGYDTDITTMAAMRAPKGYSKDNPLVINNKPYVGGMYIPGDQLEHATGEQMEEIKSGVKKADTPAIEEKPSDIKPESPKYEAVETGPGTAHEKTSKLIANRRSVKLKDGHAIKVQYDRSSRDNTGYRVTHTDPDKNKTEHPERFATLEEAASFAATMLQNKQREAKLQKQEAEPTKPAQSKPIATTRENGTPVDPTSKDVFTVPVGSLKTDAKRFQYKVKDIDADGVTQELKSVGKWNPELAGALLVWRDPENGIDYVVNGHHRHDLANRLRADSLNVRYIDAKDALEARARGALANIAEGRGSSIDAAKYLRDTGHDVAHLKNAGISLSGKVAFEATILKNLADKPFQMVTQGTLEESKAIAVAKHLKDHDLQNALFKKLEDREEDGKEWNTREIETAAKKMGNAGKYVEKGQDLFGMFEDEHSTFDQEVELEAHVARFLGQEARDFRAISSQKRADRVSDAGNTLAVDENLKRAIAAEAAAANFEREAGLRGPISALIKEHAAELAQAKTKKQKEAVKEKTFASIKEAQRAMETVAAAPEPENATKPQSLHEVEGPENTVAKVFKHEQGFSVVVHDKESGENLPSVTIHPTLDRAKAHAETMKMEPSSPGIVSPSSTESADPQKRPSTKYREAAAERIHEYARSANAVKEAIGYEATPLGSSPHYETSTHYAGSILGLRSSGADHPTPTNGDVDKAVTKGREQIVGNVKRMVERARAAGIDVTADMLKDFPEIATPQPGITMPSPTKLIEDANEGDQLGLFGEAFNAPSKKSNLKVEDPTKARQGGLFDTKGNADQMDLFGDGVMPDDLVYKPQPEPAKPEEPQQPKDNDGNEFAPGVSYGSIPTSAAYNAHRNTSFSPERRAKQRQEDFAHELNATYASLKRSAKGDENKLQILETEWPRYLERAKANYLAALSADSRTASTMITGGSNFNVARNRKKLDAAQNKWEAYSEHSDKGESAIWKMMHPELAPKKIGGADTGSYIEKEIARRQKIQDDMKTVNKVLQKAGIFGYNRQGVAYAAGHTPETTVQKLMEIEGMDEATARQLIRPDVMGHIGHESYMLTNNNANLQRYKKQAQKQLAFEREAEAASESGDEATSHQFDGGMVHLDYDDNRIRIVHDTKPSKEVISNLKSNGFKWSPKNNAWQRQLTRAAKFAAHSITGVELEKLTPKGNNDNE